jgi:hypothetical protein
MSEISKIILFIFAGREANLEVQRPYLDRILEENPFAELHLWDLTRTPEDAAYLDSREHAHGGRVQVIRGLHTGHPIPCRYPNGRERRRGAPPCLCMIHKPPYEEPYRIYARSANPDDTIYVKIDDDVLFLETARFRDFLDVLTKDPTRVVSANVANNAVCAKYERALIQKFTPSCGDPTLRENDQDWWALHTSRHFARECHDWFINNWDVVYDKTPFRTRKGEAISINCIGFTQATMKRLAASFVASPRLGDEGAVDVMLPWIVPTFHAAHLSFGPQEKAMGEAELQDYRDQYAAVAKEYLG